MTILLLLTSFILFVLSVLFGIAIGYSLGFKAEKTLKQQIDTLRDKVKSQNKSAQLKELTIAELKTADDWNFRKRLADVTGQSLLTPDPEKEEDLNSMDRMFL